MATAFVAEHRGQFPIPAMCRCLRIQPSGFYAWLRVPVSARAQEDRHQTELLHQAWDKSGKVYGYRKLHDDLIDQGESICSIGVDAWSQARRNARSCFRALRRARWAHLGIGAEVRDYLGCPRLKRARLRIKAGIKVDAAQSHGNAAGEGAQHEPDAAI